MKRKPKIHVNGEPRKFYQASRLEGKVKNVGIKPAKKRKKQKEEGQKSSI